MLIEERREVEGDPGEVWERLSSVERIPEFWHGTRSLDILEKVNEAPGIDSVRARAKFGFGGSGDVEITVDQGNKTVTWFYVSGPFRGTQTARVAGTLLEARWDIKFNGLYRLVAGWTSGHIRTGTVNALERLCGKGASVKTVSQT